MPFLSIVLSVKIVVTVLVLCVPLFLLPKEKLDAVFGFGDPSPTFYRLYGVAMLALLTAYIGGLLSVFAGNFPKEIVYMGIVSNAGAALAMVILGYAAGKPHIAIVFGVIGMGFIGSALAPRFAMSPLW